jgi:SAM-dependent methyltransferase
MVKGASIPAVLDVCCGPRMFWFDRADGRALFVDKRREVLHADTREGRRHVVVDPDILADFRALPFEDSTFSLVVFDPPHTFSGKRGWMAKKYGALNSSWREEIAAGFAECFRVLCPLGTLIFKWNEHRVPVSTILSLTPERPLFGQRCGTTAKTHWIVFMKWGGIFAMTCQREINARIKWLREQIVTLEIRVARMKLKVAKLEGRTR